MITVFFANQDRSAELPDVTSARWYTPSGFNRIVLACVTPEGKEIAQFKAEDVAGFYVHDESLVGSQSPAST